MPVAVAPPPPAPPVADSLDAGDGLLFRQVTPQRRHDQFGRDSTMEGNYLLSRGVFPTGVRTPLLSELQQKTVHQCGFEVVEKITERPKRQVYILHDANKLTIPRTDSNHKPFHSQRSPGSATGSQSHPTVGGKKGVPLCNTPLTVSVKNMGIAESHVSQSLSLAPSSSRTVHHSKYQWVRSSVPGTTIDHEKILHKDIRDPLYINTYCPGERRLRFNKTSLPRIANRARPWTVSESNPAFRFARNSNGVTSEQDSQGTTGGRQTWPVTSRQQSNFRINARDVIKPSRRVNNGVDDVEKEEEVEESKSVAENQALLEVKSYFHNEGEEVLEDQRESLKGRDACLHARVKQCIRFVRYREGLSKTKSVERPMKQEGGRYRPFSTTTIRTPRVPGPSPRTRHPNPASVEIYKEYIDAIALQTRLVSAAGKRRKKRNTASSGPQRNNTPAAASSIVEAGGSAHLSRADTNRSPTATTTSVERNDPSHHHHHSSGGGRSATYQTPYSIHISNLDKVEVFDGPDPQGVQIALDVIRLTPKPQPPRSSRTARGGRSQRQEETEHEHVEAGIEGEEGGEGEVKKEGDGREGEKVVEKPITSHNIFLPNASEATASVSSFVPDESVVDT